MGKTIEALFDGTALRPAEPLTLEPNTRVWIVVGVTPPATDTTASFLRTARSLNLDGPADWSANLEAYLYADGTQHEG
jgi:hypothetical protein